MRARVMEGTCLATLVRMANPMCKAAERQCPRNGPGRPPDFPDWFMAMLIMVAVLKRRKSKSAQYRFLWEHRGELERWLDWKGFPSRSTYFDRYGRAHGLFQVAIRLQGQRGLAEGIAEAQTVAVDKSLWKARGPEWHAKDRRAGRVPPRLRGVDRGSMWGYSEHHGWVQGYSYEVVVTATPNTTVFPLLASADAANMSEQSTFGPKIEQLPAETKNTLADSGYDNNGYGDRIEYDSRGRGTGRHFICPPQRRNTIRSDGIAQPHKGRARRQSHVRRRKRILFYRSRRGRKLYAWRGRTVEPFNDWFKTMFELDYEAWHRGLDNNRTQALAALFGYQLLVRYNHRRGRRNGQIRWILDQL
jgi:hypothetical protein